MDRHAMQAANRLLGNRPGASVLEVLLQGVRLELLQTSWLALAGADFCPHLPAWTAAAFNAGDVLEFSARGSGRLAYLAVPGGFVADPYFGSVAADPRSGLGRSLKTGDLLTAAAQLPNISTRGVARRVLVPQERRSYPGKVLFELLPGPQFDIFTGAAREAFVQTCWQISPQSDRTGYRLEGGGISTPGSMRSEPVLPGSIQVPGNGQPIITMVDGPTVGGYPKIAAFADADRDRLAQCAPGTQLHFRWADY